MHVKLRDFMSLTQIGSSADGNLILCWLSDRNRSGWGGRSGRRTLSKSVSGAPVDGHQRAVAQLPISVLRYLIILDTILINESDLNQRSKRKFRRNWPGKQTSRSCTAPILPPLSKHLSLNTFSTCHPISIPNSCLLLITLVLSSSGHVQLTKSVPSTDWD